MEIKAKEVPKKVWHFLWHEDSLASWIVSLLLAFVIVKFVFFPALSLILATSLPLVVVESTSMHHAGSFIGNTFSMQESFDMFWEAKGEWYESRGTNKTEAEKWPIRTGLEMGDIVVVSGRREPKIGDIIIFNADQDYPIIHRIIKIKEVGEDRLYTTKGDNNPGQLSSEKEISEDAIIGRAVFKIPKLGLIKLAFVRFFQSFTR